MKDRLWSVLAFLLSLSASILLFTHLCGLMSASYLPPGEVAAHHYGVLANGGSEGLTVERMLLYPLVSLAMRVFNVDLLTALKIVPALLLSSLPLLGYLLSVAVAGSRLVGVAASWILAFTPSVTTPFLVGAHGLVLSLLLFTVLLIFVFRCLERGSRGACFLAILVSVLALPPLFLLASGSSLQVQETFGLVPSVWAEDLWLSTSTAFAVSVGVYALLRRVEKGFPPLLMILAMAPLILAAVPALSSLQLLSTPVLALLAAAPLLLLQESCLVHSLDVPGHSPVSEVVIDLPKIVAVLLAAFLAVSTVAVGYHASTSTYSEHSVSSSFTDDEIASAVRWIDENVPEGKVLSSRMVAAAWFEALSKRRFVGSEGLEEALISESIESTSFRIITPSLLVDEWEPFSPSKAPSISRYDGNGYSPLAYIDDSTVWIRLVKDGEEWVESPYRAAYGGYSWLSRDPPEVILVQQFETPGLLLEKTIRVSTEKPHLSVEYRVDPKRGVELVGLELPVRVEPWVEARIVEAGDEVTRLVIGGKEAEISFGGNVANLTCGEYDEGHVMVKAEYKPVGGALEAEAEFTIQSGDRSETPLWIGHTPNLVRDSKVGYVVAEAGTMGFLDRSMADPVKSLIVKDSFNQVLFDYAGDEWVEAPSGGRVLYEEVSPDGHRFVGYETSGLRIDKTLTKSADSVDVMYAVAPLKEPTFLVTMNLTVWVPWGVLLRGYSVSGNLVQLQLGNHNLEVSFIGDPIRVEVGPDPLYGQSRIEATLRLKGGGDEVGLKISSPNPLLCKYEETTRPVMSGDDQLTLFVDPNLFTEVYKEGGLAVWRVNPLFDPK